MDVLEFNRMC